MLRHAIAVFLATISTAVAAQERFPSIDGETAAGREVSVPGASNGGFTVIGLAYGKGAQPLLEEWFEPAYLRFIAHHGLFAGTYACAVYFVPVFVGVNKAAYEPSMRRFRESAEPEIVDHVIFFNGAFDAIRQDLDLKDPDIPYFYVLDGDGRILHGASGAFSEEKLDAMEAVMLD